MDRAQFEQYLQETYPVEMDNPWADIPLYTIFRHPSNRKWFALTMTVTRDKLGLEGEGFLDAVNLKCDPLLVDAIRREPGFFPAYHMNKTHWITAALDGSADDETLKFILNMSYDLTNVKRKKR